VSVPNHFYWPIRLQMLFGGGLVWQGPLIRHGCEYSEWNYMHIRFFTFRGFRAMLGAAQLNAEKYFWDFGTLAHYHDPEMWFAPQLRKRARGVRLSRQAALAIWVLRPAWKVFNVIVPRSVRAWIVSLAPGLLCAGFYVRCVKS
ncbi:MAG: hypothetical protein ACRD5L_18720, partial [Bryobacteraceae bacterium]